MDKNIFKIKNSLLENYLKNFDENPNIDIMLKIDLELLKTLFFIPCNIVNDNYEFTFLNSNDGGCYVPAFSSFDKVLEFINHYKADYVMIVDFSELASFCLRLTKLNGCIVNFEKNEYCLPNMKLNKLLILLNEKPIKTKPSRYGLSLVENISEYVKNSKETLNIAEELNNEMEQLLEFFANHNYISKAWLNKQNSSYVLYIRHNQLDEKFFQDIYKIFEKTKINLKIKNTREAESLKVIKTLTPIYKRNSI